MSGPRHSDEISGEIVDAAFRLHSDLGPGLLESVYLSLLARSLEKRGLSVECEKSIPFEYEGRHFNNALRIDLLVEGTIVAEVKSVDSLLPVHVKQTLTYLRLAKLEVGLLINFGGATIKEGLRRVVNNYKPQYHSGRFIPRLTANSAETSKS